jgi:hypothetical protein
MLETVLREHGESWSESDRELAAAVVRDATEVALQAAAGQDVSREVAHLQAQAMSLSAAAALRAAGVIESSVRRWVGVALDTVLGRVLAPAGR